MLDILNAGSAIQLESGKAYIVFIDRDSVTNQDMNSLASCKFDCELIVMTVNVPDGATVSECVAASTAELILAERERCAKIAESSKKSDPEFSDTSEYTLGVDTTATWIEDRIREGKDRDCEPPQAKPPCTFCGHTSCNSIDCYARQAFVDRDREDPPQTELVVPSRLYREAIETLRDKFAMAALAGFGTGVAADRTAQLCYAQADAMIEARKKS